jgi:hypothetical protein
MFLDEFSEAELVVINTALMLRKQEMADLFEEDLSMVFEGLTINGILNKIKLHFEESLLEF